MEHEFYNDPEIKKVLKMGLFDPKSGNYIPFNELSNTQIRKAHYYFQKKEAELFSKIDKISILVLLLDTEANDRGLKISSIKNTHADLIKIIFSNLQNQENDNSTTNTPSKGEVSVP